MSIADELMPTYARYAAFWPRERAEKLRAELAAGRLDPMREKKRLAEEIVARYHGKDAARRAAEYFERTVQRREVPTDGLPELQLDEVARVAEVMVRAGLAESRRAAERLISGNGVKVDGVVVTDPKAMWTATEPAVLSVGSRRFVRVIPHKTT
jgi:tyrosyl-tRNA synthetase